MCNFFKCGLVFVCFVVVFGFDIGEDDSENSKILSRRRRYVTFPEGSSFSCAACLTVGLIGQPAPTSAPGTFVLAVNWGIAYELPNATESLRFYHRKHRFQTAMAQRRSRRDLYEKLEVILNNMGYSGRQCVLKTLCETKHRIMPQGNNMIEEMFRTLFSMPIPMVLPSEPIEHSIYDAAHRLSTMLGDCEAYPCPISLVDWAKGYYDAPAPTVDIAKKPWALFSSNFG